MAKKDKTKNILTADTVADNSNAQINDIVEKTKEVTAIIETGVVSNEEFNEIKTIIEEPVITKNKTIQEIFEEAIAKPPFVVFQNGVIVCHSNPLLKIKTEAKYFEINFKKYSYAGIEVKHK